MTDHDQPQNTGLPFPAADSSSRLLGTPLGTRTMLHRQRHRRRGCLAALMPRRGFLAQALCLFVALVAFPIGSSAKDEKEGGLEIAHMTHLNSAGWIYGKRGGTPGRPTRNDRTAEEDMARIKVGVGECITLQVNELKDGYRGLEDDVVWQVIEGDAYFGDDHTKTNQTYAEKKYTIQLNIRITGSPDQTQTVKVKVKTEPTVPGTSPVEKRDFYAYTILEFTRVRPNGSVKSFHKKEQYADGYWPRVTKPMAPGFVSGGKLLGAWSVLLLFPEPTDVNFGGDAEGRMHLLEIDRNPEVTNGDGTKTRPPVNIIPAPATTNLIFEPTFVHVPTPEYDYMFEWGYYTDTIGYSKESADGTPFTIPVKEAYLSADHSCEWICDWYYKDGNSAKAYNKALVKNPPSAVGVIKLNERQKFKVFAANKKWDCELEKFGSKVRRELKQSTFNQTRTHGWCPWENPASAPPYHYQDNPPAPYPYIPFVPQNN